MYYIKAQIIRYLLTALFLFNLLSIDAQSYHEYKYFVGTSEPDAGWMQSSYNDDAWNVNSFSIGYGDNDDSLVIPTTTSLYIRYEMDIYDTSDIFMYTHSLDEIEGLVIYADFDDGFIAYLNGYEVLRVNVDKSIAIPAYNQTTFRSHEAMGYRDIYRPNYGYFIDTTMLHDAGLDSVNVLAFQVLNDSVGGSDLSFMFDYTFIDEDFEYNFYWTECRYTNLIETDSIELPILVIETDEFGYDVNPHDEENDEINAHMGIINNEGAYNKPDDPFTDYDGNIRMRLRGQTSIDYPKQSFKIETQDSVGQNNNVSLMGMPAENDWILSGPFADKSLIKNEIAFSFGRKMGYYEPRTRFCEFQYNERNMGLYVLTEQIKRDGDRVNIAKLEPGETDGIDITGGYLFRFDKDQNTFEIRYPKAEDIHPLQEHYIRELWDTINDVINNNGFMDPAEGYRKYLDDTSLVDYIIINELTKNIDAYYFSCYLYKDRDDRDRRIKFGPLWDYDFSMGYSLWEDLTTSNWMFKGRTRLPVKRILQDSTFTESLANRWFELREGMLHSDSVNFMIDSMVTKLRPYIDRNYTVWPIMHINLNWHESAIAGETYDEEIANLKQWLYERSLWIDEHITEEFYPLVIYTSVDEYLTSKPNGFIHCSPNPFSSHIDLSINFDRPGQVIVDMADITGRKYKTLVHDYLDNNSQEYSIDIDENLNPGIYFLMIYYNDMPFDVKKIVKSR